MAQKYLNKKQELFCQFIAGGATQLQAYELAGYEPSSANASTLFNKPLVQQRIAELKAENERKEIEFRALKAKADEADPETAAQIAKGAEWNFQRVMDMMGENVRLAQIAGEYRAANECLKMMGEAMKMFDDAKAKNSEPANPQLNYIRNLTQVIESAGGANEAIDDGPVNPLKPSK